MTSLLQYGKVYTWLASTNHNQPRTVNRLFASPVRFLPITGCASVFGVFALRLFSGLLIAFLPPSFSAPDGGGFFCAKSKKKFAASRPRETVAAPFAVCMWGGVPSPRRGASGTPPPTVANRELSRYGRRPQKGYPSRDYCNPVGAGHARPAAFP